MKLHVERGSQEDDSDFLCGSDRTGLGVNRLFCGGGLALVRRRSRRDHGHRCARASMSIGATIEHNRP